MRRLTRILLGASILAMLIPAIAIAIPGVFGWEPDNEEREAVAQLDQNSSSDVEADRAESAPRSTVPADGDESVEGTSGASPVSSQPTLTSPTSTSTSDPDLEATVPTTEPNEDTTSSSSPATKISSPKPTTTTTAGSESASPPPANVVADGTITGDACPCTVTGTVELKGRVNLKGDLMVMGGTLVARPGVDVQGNGHQIMFMNGGSADFQGSKTSTWSGNGSNANLSRDVNFTGVSRIMFHNGAGPSTIRYIHVKNAGKQTLGFYPLHWHLNGNSARGTLVEGVVVSNSSNRAFVPHGSHGITFKDTIAKNIAGDAYWWDPGRGVNCSNDTVYNHALADHVTNAVGDNRGFRLSAFRLGCGSGNVVKNSVARNVDPSSPKDCSGFHWPEQDEGVWVFKNNASYGSECNGIFVWQNTSQLHIIDGFSGDKIDNGAYVNLYQYRNLDVSEVENHALGRGGGNLIFDGGQVGLFRMTKHVLEGGPVRVSNMTIGTFRLEDADGVPGHYILENVNIGCGDVEYADAHPGSIVTINGQNC